MHTETFMATAAQVIPTLAIALAVESTTLFRTVLTQLPRAKFDAAKTELAFYVTGIAITMAAGEAFALSALLIQYRGWTIWIPLSVTIFALLHALYGTIIIPARKIKSLVRTPRPRRVRTRRR